MMGQPWNPDDPRGGPVPPFGGRPRDAHGPVPPAGPPYVTYDAPRYSQPSFGRVPPPVNDPYRPAAWGHPLASWGKRVGSFLLDMLIAYVPGLVGYLVSLVFTRAGARSDNTAMLAIGALFTVIGSAGSLCVTVWNLGYRQGTTGMSLGKSAMHLRLVGEQTGRPIGFGLAFLRQIAHTIDSLTCYIGFLFPLWDVKRQTLADKVMGTLVLDVSADPHASQLTWTLR